MGTRLPSCLPDTPDECPGKGSDLRWVPGRNSSLPSFQMGHVSMFMQLKEAAWGTFHFALFWEMGVLFPLSASFSNKLKISPLGCGILRAASIVQIWTWAESYDTMGRLFTVCGWGEDVGRRGPGSESEISMPPYGHSLNRESFVWMNVADQECLYRNLLFFKGEERLICITCAHIVCQ